MAARSEIYGSADGIFGKMLAGWRHAAALLWLRPADIYTGDAPSDQSVGPFRIGWCLPNQVDHYRRMPWRLHEDETAPAKLRTATHLWYVREDAQKVAAGWIYAVGFCLSVARRGLGDLLKMLESVETDLGFFHTTKQPLPIVSSALCPPDDVYFSAEALGEFAAVVCSHVSARYRICAVDEGAMIERPTTEASCLTSATTM